MDTEQLRGAPGSDHFGSQCWRSLSSKLSDAVVRGAPRARGRRFC
jgi:hypothetical protein